MRGRALRQATQRRRASQTTQPVALQSPYGGLNTRDALDSMAITDAIVLDNFFPSEGKVSVRPGFTSHSTGMGAGAVETIAEYQSGTTRQLIAAADDKLFNATAAGAATDISDAGAPYTNNRWQWANFNGVIQFVNGADDPRSWDGSTMTLPAWTGTTVSEFVGVSVFKTRMFFWKTNSADFWYGASNAIAGALTNFPLSRVDKTGGRLLSFHAYTIDAGNGPDDFAVFIMDSGSVIVYQGTDPSSASTWTLAGIYQIPEPLNIRSATQVGADVMIVTAEDIVPLTTVLRGGFLGSGSKISGAVSASARINGNSFGWQIILHPAGRMLIINNPTPIGYDQWVMNTITGAWARFKDVEATCWGTYNRKLYFGGAAGVIYEFDDSYNTDNGSPIEALATQAWNDLGLPHEKRIAACRPVIASDGGINYSIDIGFDFVTPLPSDPVSVATSGSPWDTSPWDTSPWSPENIVYSDWNMCSGKGQMISTSLKLSAKQDISWLRTDYRVEIAKKL